LLAGAIEDRAHDEKLDRPIGKSLAFADLTAQVDGRAAARPEDVLQHLQMFGDLGLRKGHGSKEKKSGSGEGGEDALWRNTQGGGVIRCPSGLPRSDDDQQQKREHRRRWLSCFQRGFRETAGFGKKRPPEAGLPAGVVIVWARLITR
jgi:hypothetical protein